jgi:hypothetical protein
MNDRVQVVVRFDDDNGCTLLCAECDWTRQLIEERQTSLWRLVAIADRHIHHEHPQEAS